MSVDAPPTELLELHLGSDVVNRMRLPGPSLGKRRVGRIGSLASASTRFATALSRPIPARANLRGPENVKVNSLRDVGSEPPRWWHPALVPPAEESGDARADLPERGLPRAVRQVPNEKTWTPGGILGGLVSAPVPVRRMEAVAAAGPMLTSHDRARLTATVQQQHRSGAAAAAAIPDAAVAAGPTVPSRPAPPARPLRSFRSARTPAATTPSTPAAPVAPVAPVDGPARAVPGPDAPSSIGRTGPVTSGPPAGGTVVGGPALGGPPADPPGAGPQALLARPLRWRPERHSRLAGTRVAPGLATIGAAALITVPELAPDRAAQPHRPVRPLRRGVGATHAIRPTTRVETVATSTPAALIPVRTQDESPVTSLLGRARRAAPSALRPSAGPAVAEPVAPVRTVAPPEPAATPVDATAPREAPDAGAASTTGRHAGPAAEHPAADPAARRIVVGAHRAVEEPVEDAPSGTGTPEADGADDPAGTDRVDAPERASDASEAAAGSEVGEAVAQPAPRGIGLASRRGLARGSRSRSALAPALAAGALPAFAAGAGLLGGLGRPAAPSLGASTAARTVSPMDALQTHAASPTTAASATTAAPQTHAAARAGAVGATGVSALFHRVTGSAAGHARPGDGIGSSAAGSAHRVRSMRMTDLLATGRTLVPASALEGQESAFREPTEIRPATAATGPAAATAPAAAGPHITRAGESGPGGASSGAGWESAGFGAAAVSAFSAPGRRIAGRAASFGSRTAGSGTSLLTGSPASPPLASPRAFVPAPPPVTVIGPRDDAPPVPASARPAGPTAAAAATGGNLIRQSLVEATAHLFAGSEAAGAPVAETTGGSEMPPDVHRPYTITRTAADVAAAAPPAPPGARNAPFDYTDSRMLDDLVDKVVDRIEARVVDELERRGRRHNLGAF